MRFRSIIDSSSVRTRWAAIGAAVTVALGGGGWWVAEALPGPEQSAVVAVSPERILDTRDPLDVGLAGPFVSAVPQKLQVTGAVATTTGTRTVVPVGATGALLNVTVVAPSAAGFVSVRPGDATGSPTTSSLNFEAGVIAPNAVQVAMPTAGPNAGQIDITYSAFEVAGPTADLLVDVVGYTTNSGMQELVTELAAKANATDVYTKSEVDATAANALAAYGAVNSDGTRISNGPSFRTFTSSRQGLGTYVVAITGAARGCSTGPRGTFPLVVLDDLGTIAANVGTSSVTCDGNSGDMSLTVWARDMSGAPMDSSFGFFVYFPRPIGS